MNQWLCRNRKAGKLLKEIIPEQGKYMQERQPRRFHAPEKSHLHLVGNNERDKLGEQSIFNFFSIENTVKFHRDMTRAGLPQEERRFYESENLFRFLGEFAGKVPYTTISYLLKDNGLYFGDINTSDVYEKTAQMTASGSIEWAEYEGHQNILHLLHNQNNNVVEFSPTRDGANYGFAFVWEKGAYNDALGGTPVTMQAVRYDESMESVDTTAQAVRRLMPDTNVDILPNANSYIANPFVLDDSIQTEDIMHAVDLDTSDIQKSRLYEDAIRRELGMYAGEWIAAVEEVAAIAPGTVEHTRHMSRLETMLEGIFNMATDIQDRIEGGDWDERILPTIAPNTHEREAVHMMLIQSARQKQATVTGGGSCPVTTDNSSGGVYGALLRSPIEALMHKGVLNTTENSSTNHSSYACPECGHEYPGETSKDRNDWVINCQCGFEFGC